MKQDLWGNGPTQFFYDLDPETILDQIDNLGFRTSGRLLALNSMENRVYQIGIEQKDEVTGADESFIVVKFYRPGRWSKEQILEEHEFLMELREEDLPVVTPIKRDGQTLFQTPQGLYFSLFERIGGRAVSELDGPMFTRLGHLLARTHLVGGRKPFKHRLSLNTQSMGYQNLNYLEQSKNIPLSVEKTFHQVANQFLKVSDQAFSVQHTIIRSHGDTHLGNLLQRGEGLTLLDFDDAMNAPAIQDFWLLIPQEEQRDSDDDDYKLSGRDLLIEAYDEIRTFPYQELKMIEALRGLRYLHFAAWLAKRWEDPAFKVAFPHFESPHYFEGVINDLREQTEKLDQVLNQSYY